MSVADMNRLEQAARISMGEFQDPAIPAQPLSAPNLSLLRIAILAAAALFLLTAFFHLS